MPASADISAQVEDKASAVNDQGSVEQTASKEPRVGDRVLVSGGSSWPLGTTFHAVVAHVDASSASVTIEYLSGERRCVGRLPAGVSPMQRTLRMARVLQVVAAFHQTQRMTQTDFWSQCHAARGHHCSFSDEEVPTDEE
eukprot:4563402-Pleurochrysis_carterae.AAC.2